LFEIEHEIPADLQQSRFIETFEDVVWLRALCGPDTKDEFHRRFVESWDPKVSLIETLW
jgi:hypothetical protein